MRTSLKTFGSVVNTQAEIIGKFSAYNAPSLCDSKKLLAYPKAFKAAGYS